MLLLVSRLLLCVMEAAASSEGAQAEKHFYILVQLRMFSDSTGTEHHKASKHGPTTGMSVWKQQVMNDLMLSSLARYSKIIVESQSH